MTKAEIIALAERCEAAEGPDRELDAEIALVVGASGGNPIKSPGCAGWLVGSATNPSPVKALEYTASLDAAMTLVPVKSLWSVCDMEEGPFAQVIRLWDRERYFRSHAATPALALTASALKAIAEEMDG